MSLEEYLSQQVSWAENFEDDESLDAFKMIHSIGKSIEALAGTNTATKAIEIILNDLQDDDHLKYSNPGFFGETNKPSSLSEWEKMFVSPSELVVNYDTLSYQGFFDGLNCYAFAGGLPSDKAIHNPTQKAIDDSIRSGAQAIENFKRHVPYEYYADTDLDRTMKAFLARYKLEYSYDDITVEELAALLRKSVKRTRNILSENNDVIELKDGLLKTDQIGIWIRSQDGYVESIWKQLLTDEGVGDKPSYKPNELNSSSDAFIFIPHQKNSPEAFLPDTTVPGGYKIGGKGAGNSRIVADYWQALHELTKMPVPRWWRKSSSGNPGAVVGSDTWARYSKEYIQKMIDVQVRAS
jgi:hypothetical protein